VGMLSDMEGKSPYRKVNGQGSRGEASGGDGGDVVLQAHGEEICIGRIFMVVTQGGHGKGGREVVQGEMWKGRSPKWRGGKWTSHVGCNRKKGKKALGGTGGQVGKEMFNSPNYLFSKVGSPNVGTALSLMSSCTRLRIRRVDTH